MPLYEVRAAELMISHHGIVEAGTVVPVGAGSDVTGSELSKDVTTDGTVVTGAAGFITGMEVVCSSAAVGGDVTEGCVVVCEGAVVTLYILVVISATEIGVVPVVVSDVVSVGGTVVVSVTSEDDTTAV